MKETTTETYERGKTLWDWLQLLIIPAVLVGATLLFNMQNTLIQREVTHDSQREAALQAYINSDMLPVMSTD